jgi:dihydrofolate reductase
MASYWPTPLAFENDRAAAERMNDKPKLVFSRTLRDTAWQNSRLVKADITREIRRMKAEPGGDMVILGSGSIVAQLGTAGVIDEYQIVVNQVVLGKGRTMFDGVGERLPLRLTGTRTFGNGNVLLRYAPATRGRARCLDGSHDGTRRGRSFHRVR